MAASREVTPFGLKRIAEALASIRHRPPEAWDATRWLAGASAHARSLGLSVECKPLEHARGYCKADTREIVLADDIGSANAVVRVLVHELAHAHGVSYKDYSRPAAEVVVETAATIVCGSLGLDTSGESIPYLAEWGESGDLDAIRKHAEAVDGIAASIEQAGGLKGGQRCALRLTGWGMQRPPAATAAAILPRVKRAGSGGSIVNGAALSRTHRPAH